MSTLLGVPDEELTSDERRQKAGEILSRRPVPVRRMTPPPAEKGLPCPGEVWLTAAPKDDPEAWTLQVIVLSADNDLALTVSILPDPSEAGPEDRILPKEVLGYEAAVSFELKAVLPISVLTACQGSLAEADFAAVRSAGFSDILKKWQKNGTLMPMPCELPRGMTYIDEEDFRYVIHVEMAERIGELQASIWDKIVP